jgi:hypothetical protein
MKNPNDHVSFLLRLWRVDSMSWLASLEDTTTGERKGFANLELLAQFLRSLTDEAKSTGEKYEQNLRLPPEG